MSEIIKKTPTWLIALSTLGLFILLLFSFISGKNFKIANYDFGVPPAATLQNDILLAINDLKTSVGSLQTSVAVIQNDIVEIKADVKELQTSVAVIQNDIVEIKDDVKELKNADIATHKELEKIKLIIVFIAPHLLNSVLQTKLKKVPMDEMITIQDGLSDFEQTGVIPAFLEEKYGLTKADIYALTKAIKQLNHNKVSNTSIGSDNSNTGSSTSISSSNLE